MLRYEDYVNRREKGEPIGVNARYEVLRYELEYFYGREISLELIEIDDGGKYRDAVRRFEKLQLRENQSHVEQKLVEYWKGQPWLVAFSDKTASLLDSLLISANIVRDSAFVPTIEICTYDLEPFQALWYERRATIEREFGIRAGRALWKRPISKVNALLDLVGLSMVMSTIRKIEGKKVYYYQLNPDRLTAMKAVLEDREKAADARMSANEGRLPAKSDRWETRSPLGSVRGAGEAIAGGNDVLSEDEVFPDDWWED